MYSESSNRAQRSTHNLCGSEPVLGYIPFVPPSQAGRSVICFTKEGPRKGTCPGPRRCPVRLPAWPLHCPARRVSAPPVPPAVAVAPAVPPPRPGRPEPRPAPQALRFPTATPCGSTRRWRPWAPRLRKGIPTALGLDASGSRSSQGRGPLLLLRCVRMPRVPRSPRQALPALGAPVTPAVAPLTEGAETQVTQLVASCPPPLNPRHHCPPPTGTATPGQTCEGRGHPPYAGIRGHRRDSGHGCPRYCLLAWPRLPAGGERSPPAREDGDTGLFGGPEVGVAPGKRSPKGKLGLRWPG